MLHILTLTWNGCDKLSKLKESLIPALEGVDYTWWIKDNASIDKTCETVSTWGDKVKLLKYKDNLQNFAQGMNYLFNACDAQDKDHILLLNNDIVVGDTTSIKTMIAALKNDIGVVGAKLLFSNTDKLQHAGVVFNRNGLPIHFRHNQSDDDAATKNRLFQAVTGAVMLLKAEDYKTIYDKNKSGIKGMCEELIWCFDDIDACVAITNNTNKKILYCGNTKIFHEESASLKINPVNKLFMNHNVNYFTNKWRGKYSVDVHKYVTDAKYNLYK